MNNKLKTMINEEFNRSLQGKKTYTNTRKLIENYVREALLEKIITEKTMSKLSQVQQALSDPAINKSGLARKISGLSSDDDARRSEISKIARGVWEPPTEIQNDILHVIASDT